MIVIRTGPPYYNLIIDALSSKIPKQQVLSVGKDLEIAVDTVKYAPIFGAYYLIIWEYQKGKTYWQTLKDILSKPYVKVIILTRTKDDYLTVIAKSEKSSFEIDIHYDSYKASVKDKNVYIKRVILEHNPKAKLTKTAINTIRERLSGYSVEVNGYLQQLAWLPLTSDNIKKIIPKRSMLTPASFGWMLYDRKISIAEADELILRYQYYPYVLIESLKKYNDKLLKMFPYYLHGDFTEINVDEFVSSTKLIQNSLVAKSYLEVYERISIERLYQIDSMLSGDTSSRISNILTLYKIVRLVGGKI